MQTRKQSGVRWILKVCNKEHARASVVNTCSQNSVKNIVCMYRRSSNTSRLLELVCYYAVIKLWKVLDANPGCKHGGKRCSLLSLSLSLSSGVVQYTIWCITYCGGCVHAG